jgi:integrase
MMASTIAVCLEFVRTALRWAVEQGMLTKCPKFPKVDVPETLPQPVPVEGFERLYARAEGDGEMQAFLICAWLAGLRLDEARELEWEENDAAPWLDLPHDRIVLPARFVKGKSDQTVTLDRQLALALAALPRTGPKVFRFRSQRGARLCAASVSMRVSRLAKRAGVRLTYKSLRRGFGCYWAARVSAQVLQRLMRHRDIETTLRYYVNVDEAATAAILNREPSAGISGGSCDCNTQRNSQPESA